METLQSKIIQNLMVKIENGKHGDMLPSQNVLRTEFKASTVTIRMALEKLEKDGLVFRQQGKGCFIRKLPNNERLLRIFLILPRNVDHDNEFFSNLFSIARDKGCHLMFFIYSDNCEQLKYELKRFGPDAILWGAPNVKQEYNMLKLLSAQYSSVLVFNRICNLPKINYISVDFFDDGMRLGEAFYNKLCKKGKVLYIGFDEREEFSRLRHEGFMQYISNKVVVDTLPFGANKYKSGDLVPAISQAMTSNQYAGFIVSQGALWKDLEISISKNDYDHTNAAFAIFDNLPAETSVPQNICYIVQPLLAMSHAVFDSLAKLKKGEISEIKKVFSSDLI